MSDDGITPRLVDALRDVMAKAVSGVHVSMPGQIISYNPATQVAQVKPAVKLRLSDERDEVTGLFPFDSLPIVSVPVYFPTGGGFAIVWTPLPGDWVQLVVSSHEMDTWLSLGLTEIEPQSSRRHDLSDSWAIPGVQPISQPRPSAVLAGTDLVLGRLDGTTEIRISPTDIKLGGALAIDPVALSTANDANWSALTAWVRVVETLINGLLPGSFPPAAPPTLWGSSAGVPAPTAATVVKGL